LEADDAGDEVAVPRGREAHDGLERTVEDRHDRLRPRAAASRRRVAYGAEPPRDLPPGGVQADGRPEAAIVDQRNRNGLELPGVLKALVERAGCAGEERHRGDRELAREPALDRVVAGYDAFEPHAPARVRPRLLRLLAHHHEVNSLEARGVEPVALDDLVR